MTALRWSAPRLAVTAIGSFLAAVLVSTAVVLALGMRSKAAQLRTPEEILLLALLSDGALLLGLFALGRVLLRLRLGDLGFRRPPPGALRTAAWIGGGLWLLSILVNALQIQVFGADPQPLIVTVGAHTGPAALVMDLTTGAVVAPFAEEVLFRGLIFGGLAQRIPFAAAAAISALLFALSHGLGVVAPIFVLGLGLAYVYARSGSIWAPMTTHAVVNAISLLLLFAAPKA
ncbi:MAG: CPBP family intramembrane metalloprotease [Chloroflexi bacterium]|nr:CPBP family intramembrane metalloprotease [Chloroflexota bacterium]